MPLKFTRISCIFLIAFNSYGQLTGDTYASAANSKTAKFYYVHDGTPRFAQEKDGQMTGLAIDIMKEFEKFLRDEKGIQVSAEPIYRENFEEFMQEIKTSKGGVFGLSNISINEDRKKTYSFSPPFLDNVLVLLSNGNLAPLTNMEGIADHFRGMTAYSLPGSSYLSRLQRIRDKHFPDMQISELPSETEIIQRLDTDEKAFAILDVTYYLEILKNELNIRRHSKGDEKNDQFGVIMPKNSDWEPLIREFFNSGFIGSQTYSKLVSINLGNSSLRLLEIKN